MLLGKSVLFNKQKRRREIVKKDIFATGVFITDAAWDFLEELGELNKKVNRGDRMVLIDPDYLGFRVLVFHPPVMGFHGKVFYGQSRYWC